MKRRVYTLLALLLFSLAATNPAPAQTLVGDAVVTCEATSAGNPTFGIIKVQSAYGQPLNANYAAPMFHNPSWTLSNTGEVFGIALDKAGNIYLTASTCYLNDIVGPGGWGAIYKVDGLTGVITTFPALPNPGGVGLGNICFDPDHDIGAAGAGQLFVTNTEDGKIYRVDPTTGVAAALAFDPFGGDPGIPGPAPLGERLWGIGYYRTAGTNGRVYFARWQEDAGHPNPAVANEIWSVGLNALGDFLPGPPTLEVTIPALTGFTYSNPVADIEFSQDGHMLLGERTMTDYTTPSAHRSRVLEYWPVPTPPPSGHTFAVGQLTTGSDTANASGGVDYGYRTFNKNTGGTDDCDSTVWAMGDALHITLPYTDVVYGLQMFPASGGSIANSVLIDLDGNTTTQQKTALGDVDIFKVCGKESHSCARLTTTLVATGGAGCCWSLTATNSDAAGFWTSIQVRSLSTGVTFGTVSPVTGWTVTPGLTLITYAPSPAGTFIPLGANGPFVFCLTLAAGAPTTQQIEVRWIGSNNTVCVDTLTTNCRPPVTPKCASLVNLSVVCKDAGASGTTYAMQFAIRNDPTNTFSMAGAYAFVTKPSMGVTLSPWSFVFPVVAPGGTTAPLSTTIFGGHPGDTICLAFLIYDLKRQSWCKFDTCFILPQCRNCCDPLRLLTTPFKILTSTSGAAIVATTVTATIPLRSLTVAVVSATRRIVCPGSVGAVTSVAAVFNGGALSAPMTGPAGAGTAQLVWGVNYAGVPMTGASLALGLQFPPAPGWKCRDTLRFCLKLTYQDTACHTCDTTICLTAVRYGLPIWSVPDPGNPVIIVPPFGPGIGEDDGGPGGTKRERARLQSAPASDAITIRMSSESEGTLSIVNPALDRDADPASSVTITGIDIEPAVGTDLVSVTDAATQQVGAPRDRVISLELQQPISSGVTRDFQLVYDNTVQALSFDNYITLHFRQGDGEEDKTTVVVNARTPNGSGGDNLFADDGITLTNVRTYGLSFTNGNANRDGICRVVVHVTSDGDDIAAVGPPIDRTEAALRGYKDNEESVHLLPEVPGTDVAVEALVPADTTVTPIFVTVCGGDDQSVSFSYTTYDQHGNVVSTGTVDDDTPLSSFQSGVPNAVSPGSVVSLVECSPNPAKGTVTFSFTLNRDAAQVVLAITDGRGVEVARAIDGRPYAAGHYDVPFNVSTLPSGTYYYVLRAGGVTQTRKLEIVR